MSEFFKHAPVRETAQKRFLESIFHKQNVLGSFPLGYDAVSLYAFAAMMGEGMCVVVCPDVIAVQRRVEYFGRASYRYPEVAVLDGTQVPHEMRETVAQVNRNRVKVLLTTPEHFATLRFLEVLIHARLSFLVIEQAQFLLPDFSGSFRYLKLWEALERLRVIPPMVLLTHPLPVSRTDELTKALGWKPDAVQVFREEPLPGKMVVRVRRLMTEHQKFRYLVHHLSGQPQRGMMGRIYEPGSVLILTRDTGSCEQLALALSNHGYEGVYSYHGQKEDPEKLAIERIFATEPNRIIVQSGYDADRLTQPENLPLKIIFWHPPASVEEAYGQMARACRPDHGEVEGWFLYTREDYEISLKRTQLLGTSRYAVSAGFLDRRLQGLKRYRRWVLSESCRLQSLVAFAQGADRVSLPPCGRCDRCREPNTFPNRIRRLFKYWLY